MNPENPVNPLVPVIATAAKQSGIAFLFACVLGYAVNRVYEDLGRRNEVLVRLVSEQVESSRMVSSSVVSLTVAIESQTNSLRRLEDELARRSP